MTNTPQQVALVANGLIEDHDFIASLIKKYAFVVAVDGGLLHCEKMHIKPDLIIGDLDSVPTDILKNYPNTPTKKFPKEKDETDLELALLAVKDQFSSMALFATLGHRLDHTLYNLHLLRRYSKNAVIESERETIFCIQGKTQVATTPGQTISFIPLGAPVVNVSSRGLKWELKQATFNKDFMSISNICLGDAVTLEIGEGDLLCCLHRNDNKN